MIDYESIFDDHRPFLWGYCYRLTGSVADAEDAVQETFVRALERPPPDLERPWRPWLVQVATNLIRDQWRAARNDYVGSWMPAPIETESDSVPWRAGIAEDAQGRYEVLESVSFAFLLALEALSPRQRAVLILRDVYGHSGKETGEALGLSVGNVKTTLHRARAALKAYDRDRQPPSADLAKRHRAALDRLLACFATRDVHAMEQLLALEVSAVSDANGRYHAARRPVLGRRKVALFFSNIVPEEEVLDWEIRTLNGLPALLFQRADPGPGLAPRWVFRIELDEEDRVATTQALLAPRKLSRVAFRPLPASAAKVQ